MRNEQDIMLIIMLMCVFLSTMAQYINFLHQANNALAIAMANMHWKNCMT